MPNDADRIRIASNLRELSKGEYAHVCKIAAALGLVEYGMGKYESDSVRRLADVICPDAAVEYSQGIGDMCCTCSKVITKNHGDRKTYCCSLTGKSVSKKRRACGEFDRDGADAIMLRLTHGTSSYAIGCRCKECVDAHDESNRIAHMKARMR